MVGLGLGSPFIRQAELADIHLAIDGENCRAVFLSYDTGLGASSILRELVLESGQNRAVLTLQGTPSLSAVPFGALAPILRGIHGDTLGLRTQVFRAVLKAIDDLKNTQNSDLNALPLIVLDDAHAVDTSTAELLVDLVLAGSVILVASHLRSRGMPEPLPRLWSAGLAENIDMTPLTRDQTHAYCQALLQGPVALQTSWYFWSSAKGNPLLIKLLVSEAVDDALLTQSRGVWVYQEGPRTVGRNLRDAVAHQIRGLSIHAEEALDLVALAEPVSLILVEAISGEAAVKQLVERELVHVTDLDNGTLRLASPIYGDVIRHTVSPAHRRILFDAMNQRMDSHRPTGEGLLRWVSWAIDCGLDVADELLLQAALIACKLSQPLVSLELTRHITGQDNALRVAAIKSRAEYLRGDYQAAAILLDDTLEEAHSVEDLIFASLLKVATRMALGMPASGIADEIEQLETGGLRLAGQAPAEADTIHAMVEDRVKLLKLMAFSQTGQYRNMEPLIAALKAGSAVPEAERKLVLTFALTMEAEQLCAQGRLAESQQRSSEAFAIEHSDDYDIFFIPEMIVFRQLTTALVAGDLDQAQLLLDRFFVDAGSVILSFGGSANVGRGMGYVRQGRFDQAVEALLPCIESLRATDPQQLLGFCTALTAYSAAQLGQVDLASGLLADYQEKPGMFLITSHERAFAAAAREHLKHDGVGLAALMALADESRKEGSALLELNALVLAMELGELNHVDRLLDVAAHVDGPWSAAVVQFVGGTRKNHVAKSNGSDRGPKVVHSPALADVPWYSGNNVDVPGMESASSAGAVNGQPLIAQNNGDLAMLGKLTKRESQITLMAANGLTDRAIAGQLQLSLRTVEGHLYRAYSKLGITSRDELAPLLAHSGPTESS
ncbi:LuxR C-terminal-related transcriptional regulator [Arthrobacter sp. TWP1-1]|uniref:helix-turn-helix transcriptional regulator n=1 Tax=Arthrobacter sp. TWP1-1 TaxID=2804568 RepID=UPI003CEA3EC5